MTNSKKKAPIWFVHPPETAEFHVRILNDTIKTGMGFDTHLYESVGIYDILIIELQE